MSLLLIPNIGATQDFEKGLSEFSSENYDAALREWMPLAVQGQANAQFAIGVMYATGRGVNKSNSEAAYWYLLSAKGGNVLAQIEIGTMYAFAPAFDGAVDLDFVASHMWLNIAASSGNEEAIEMRDRVASFMTDHAIHEAQRKASQCIRSNYEDCE